MKRIASNTATPIFAAVLASSVAMGGNKEGFRYIRTLGSTLLDIPKRPAKALDERGAS
jgi:hypothetical protein